MLSSRLIHLQNRLSDLYGILAGQEQALDFSAPEQKDRIRLLIRTQKRDIQDVHQDFWVQLSQEIRSLSIPNDLADVAVAEIIQEVEILSAKAAYPAAIETKLEQILAELKKPEAPAEGKLKAVIPLLPGLVTYEVELDTQGLLKQLFPTFCKILGK